MSVGRELAVMGPVGSGVWSSWNALSERRPQQGAPGGGLNLPLIDLPTYVVKVVDGEVPSDDVRVIGWWGEPRLGWDD